MRARSLASAFIGSSRYFGNYCRVIGVFVQALLAAATPVPSGTASSGCRVTLTRLVKRQLSIEKTAGTVNIVREVAPEIGRRYKWIPGLI